VRERASEREDCSQSGEINLLLGDGWTGGERREINVKTTSDFKPIKRR
jgi:hypothetical protein